MSEFISTEEVCGRLSRAGIDPKTVSKVFAARPKPCKLDADGNELPYEHDPDKVYVLAVPEPGGRAFLVTYKFGLGNPLRPDPTVQIPQEQGPDWRPRWLAVNGPYEVSMAGRELDPECELAVRARELTNG